MGAGKGAINTQIRRSATELAEPAIAPALHLGNWTKVWRRALAIGLLLLADVLFALLAWEIAVGFQGALGHGSLAGINGAIMAPSVVVWISLRALLGLYPGYGLGQVEELRRQTLALFATLAVTIVFAFASQIGDMLSRLLLFSWTLELLLLAPLTRHFTKQMIMRLGLWGKPVMILGVQKAGAQVLKVLKREWQLGFRPIAVFCNHLTGPEGVLGSVSYGGTVEDALRLARQYRVDTAIMTLPDTPNEHFARFASLARRNFRHVVLIPDLGGVTNSSAVARDLAGTFGIEIKHNLLDPWAQHSKRLIDIVATIIGGVLILPVITVLCLLVWIESPGAVFYRDQRMGRDGGLFWCVKFRTMVPEAEDLLQKMLAENEDIRAEYSKFHKLGNDPRITRIGYFLRKTSLDELPQLWNVLRGDMSLVGPRPYLPRESEDIGETQEEILRVTPGITGPWQVAGRNDVSFDGRVLIDAQYVRDWSLWLDLILLVRTVKVVLLGRGAG